MVELKIKLLQKFPGPNEAVIKTVIQYNKKYRKKNNNVAVSKSMVNKVLSGRACRHRKFILRAINDIL